MKVSDAIAGLITAFGVGLILAIVLFYWYGGTQYIQSFAGAIATINRSYGESLLKGQYPI